MNISSLNRNIPSQPYQILGSLAEPGTLSYLAAESFTGGFRKKVLPEQKVSVSSPKKPTMLHVSIEGYGCFRK